MALRYRDDDGLSVLALAEDTDLGRLADLLTHDETDGEKRVAQQLLDDPAFRAAQAAGSLSPVWSAIAAELQAFGGDGVANKVRGTGVAYRDILDDLAGLLGVGFDKAADVPAREHALVQQLLLDRYFPKGEPTRSPPSRAAAREFGHHELIDGTLTPSTLQARLNEDEEFFLGAILVLRRLPLVALKLSTDNLLLAVKGLSRKQSVTGAAYRVTLPAVLEVARIRRKVLRNPLNLGEA